MLQNSRKAKKWLLNVYHQNILFMYSETNKNWKQSTFEDMLTLLKSTQVSCTLWIYFKNRWPQSEGFWFNYSFPGDTCLWFVLFSAVLLFLFLHWSFFSNFSFDLSILRPHHPCLLVIFVNCPACISATPSAHSSFYQILPFILFAPHFASWTKPQAQ